MSLSCSEAIVCQVTLVCGPRVGKGTSRSSYQVETVLPLHRWQRVQLQVHLDQHRPMQIDLGIVRGVTEGKAGIEIIHMAEADELHPTILYGLRGPPNTSQQWMG